MKRENRASEPVKRIHFLDPNGSGPGNGHAVSAHALAGETERLSHSRLVLAHRERSILQLCFNDVE